MELFEKPNVSEEIAAKAVGSFILKVAKSMWEDDTFEIVTKSRAEQALQEIRDVMENHELSDFMCIDGIIAVFDRYGIDTFRHDFG